MRLRVKLMLSTRQASVPAQISRISANDSGLQQPGKALCTAENRVECCFVWIAVQELKFKYHNSGTILSSTYPYYIPILYLHMMYPYSGNLTLSSFTATQSFRPQAGSTAPTQPGPEDSRAEAQTFQNTLIKERSSNVKKGRRIMILGTFLNDGLLWKIWGVEVAFGWLSKLWSPFGSPKY